MRIIIDTEAQESVSVTSEKSGVVSDNSSGVATAPTYGEGGSAPASMEAVTTAKAYPSDGVLTIDAGAPSSDLVSAIMIASAPSNFGEFLDAGSAPSF